MKVKSELPGRVEEIPQAVTAPPAETKTSLPPLAESQPINGGVTPAAETPKPVKVRTAVPESKHDALVRLADKRVTKACKCIALVGNLAAYKPSALEIERIEQTLGEACARTINRLNGVRNESITFSLR